MTSHGTETLQPPVRPGSATPGGPVHTALTWLRVNLFSTWYNALLTIAAVWFIWYLGSNLISWGFVHAAFGAGPKSCENIEGACWSMIRDMWPLFIVGAFPADERWRPSVVLAMFVILIGLSLSARARGHRAFFPVWAGSLIVIYFLMRGGSFTGLVPVDTTRWGGLVLTVLLTVVGLSLAFPFSIVLALGRRSRMPVIKAICVAYIELIRGVPLITVLFMASVML
ncbi:MAG TPA: ABC transporter permease subunit, partial [bacterium]